VLFSSVSVGPSDENKFPEIKGFTLASLAQALAVSQLVWVGVLEM
jgi:hypothetical protein